MINKMDFFNAFNQNIEMVRGDSLAFAFQLAGLGSEAAYNDFDVLFCVAETYDSESLIEVDKTNGISLAEYDVASDTATFTVFVEPILTKNLDLMRYYYDLQIKDDENTITLMRGRLELVYDVAD